MGGILEVGFSDRMCRFLVDSFVVPRVDNPDRPVTNEHDQKQRNHWEHYTHVQAMMRRNWKRVKEGPPQAIVAWWFTNNCGYLGCGIQCTRCSEKSKNPDGSVNHVKACAEIVFLQ